MLEFLQKNKLVAWIFFIAAFVWAVTTISGAYSWIFNLLKPKEKYQNEYWLLKHLDTWISSEYVKSIFWEPNKAERCSEEYEISYPFFFRCEFAPYSKYKFSYETELYILEFIFTDSNLVWSYTLFSKNKDFKPSFDIYFGRFVWFKNIQLNKTRHEVLLEINEERFSTVSTESIVWTRYAGFFSMFYSWDYDVKNAIYLSTVAMPFWSNRLSYYSSDCDFWLLQLENELYKETEDFRIKTAIFSKNCPIQWISLVNEDVFGEAYWRGDSEEVLKILEQNLAYFYYS